MLLPFDFSNQTNIGIIIMSSVINNCVLLFSAMARSLHGTILEPYTRRIGDLN